MASLIKYIKGVILEGLIKKKISVLLNMFFVFFKKKRKKNFPTLIVGNEREIETLQLRYVADTM